MLALSAERLEHNLRLMETYATRHGLAFAPHGKTSMAPQLFHRQIEHGAWGITLAVPHQVRRWRGPSASSASSWPTSWSDAAALRWISSELDADPDFRFVCYVDSVRGVGLMDAALSDAGASRPVDVVVELAAGEGARTGVRTEAECAAVADAVAGARTLRLAGVAGYEGEVPDADAEKVHAWLRRLVALAVDFDKAGRFDGLADIVVSAGGSAWFDAVADVSAEVPDLSLPVLKLLRSGAYVSHDDGPLPRADPLQPGPRGGRPGARLRLWSQVVSRPSPEQAFTNAGKRDAAYDLHLPLAQVVRRDGAERPATGVEVTGLSDQHAWLRTTAEADLEVGDRLGTGLSHPCTSFDKWQLIPVAQADGTVVDYIRTFF